MHPINSFQTMKFTFRILLAVLVISGFSVRADEGMWMPIFLKQLNEQAMMAKGCKLTAEDIYSVNKTSLKDAICQFDGGCTAEVISKEGLLLTNHHCGYDFIQKHSTPSKDLLKDGFWAYSKDQEIPCPGATASFLIRMEDVTKQVLNNIPNGISEIEREAAIKKNIESVIGNAIKGTHYSAFVRPMFYGTEYYLFVNEVFTDIRMVGAPPSSIGKFGGDTDNWMWPRHTGDFSLFRIYAAPDGKPAPFSNANIPFKPRNSLKINTKGVKEGDFTMVLGYPGRTQEYLTSYALEIITQTTNSPKIALLRKRLDILEEAMAQSTEQRIQFAARQSGLANGWKKWMGENMGIRRSGAIEKKQGLESRFAVWANQDAGRKPQYGNVVENLKRAYGDLKPIILGVEYNRFVVNATEVMSLVMLLDKADKIRDKKPELEKAIDDYKKQLESFYKQWRRPVDEKTFAVALEAYCKDIPTESQPEELKRIADEVKTKYDGNYFAYSAYVFDNSMFTQKERLNKLAERVKKGKSDKLYQDPIYQIWAAWTSHYNKYLLPKYQSVAAEIESNNRLFLKGLREMQPERKFYPDANSTFRVAYGQVAPYYPADGVKYHWQTTLSGVMEKENPSSEEFEVPAKLKELYSKKDFGRYGENGLMPLAFIATNHTTGGNSGSPVIDGEGRLIGTNFDRVWEGTMSDLNYDPNICRNVTLDIRYTLFIIDKFAGAQNLIKEMELE